MFMFSKLNVYSAPISVGSAPISKEVFFPACSLTKPCGTGPKKLLSVLSVARNGVARAGRCRRPPAGRTETSHRSFE